MARQLHLACQDSSVSILPIVGPKQTGAPRYTVQYAAPTVIQAGVHLAVKLHYPWYSVISTFILYESYYGAYDNQHESCRIACSHECSQGNRPLEQMMSFGARTCACSRKQVTFTLLVTDTGERASTHLWGAWDGQHRQ